MKFESSKQASFEAKQAARRMVADAPADRDDARRMFKRQAARAIAKFDASQDEHARVFWAVFASAMKVEAEARA